MTLALTGAMETRRLSTEKRPVYSVQFEGCPFAFGSGDFAGAAPLRFGDPFEFGDTNPDTGVVFKFGDGLATGYISVPVIDVPTGFGANVTPSQGQSSISGGTVPILHCPEVTELITTYGPLRGKKVTVRAGFDPVAALEWPIVFTGIVKDLEPSDDGTRWTIHLADRQRDLTRDIFACVSTELSHDASAVATTLTCPLGTALGVFESTGYVRVKDEVMSYSSITADASHDYFNGLVRGLLGTVATALKATDKVGEVLVLTGNPVDLALQVLTSTGTGTNGSFDVLPARHGLAVPSSEVVIQDAGDPCAYLSVRASFPLDAFEFWIQKPTNGKRWLEDQIYKPNGLYQVIRGDGRLALKIFAPPAPNADLPAFMDSVVLSAVASGAFDRQYNQVVWSFDEDLKGEFKTVQTETDDASVARYGHTWSMPIEAKGLRSYFADGTPGNGQAVATARSGRLMSRYAEPPMEIRCEALFEMFHVEQGDLVTFACSVLLDAKKGVRGIPESGYIMEVVSRHPNYEQGTMSFELHYTPFAGARYAKRGPIGLADYDSATEPQRTNYGFIGSGWPDTTVGAANDPPYRRS